MAHSELYIRIMNSKEWKQTRNNYLSEHPLCEECILQGKVRPAQCVHHKREIESARTDAEARQLATMPSNLMALCFACHSDIHTKRGSHTKEGHQQRASERLEQFKARVKGQKGDP